MNRSPAPSAAVPQPNACCHASLLPVKAAPSLRRVLALAEAAAAAPVDLAVLITNQ